MKFAVSTFTILASTFAHFAVANEINSVIAEATVRSFHNYAMSEYIANEPCRFYDGVTFLFAEPKQLIGKSVTIYYFSDSIPNNSKLRNPGSRFRFSFNTEFLKGIKNGQLFQGALQNLQYLPPSKEKRRAQQDAAANP